MKRIACIFALLFAASAHAQTLSPLTNECSHKCDGQFVISNQGLTPLVVTVEPASFTPTDKGGTSRALDSTVDLKLSASSARIPPRGQYTFSYKATCNQTPCAVRVMAGMIVGHTEQGLNVKVVLGHAIYLCDRAKGCRNSVLNAAGVQTASK